MRNKFAYSYSIKLCVLGFSELLESIFSLLLAVEAFSLQRVVEMLEEVVVCWWEVRWIRQMTQNFVAQLVQLLKCWLCNVGHHCGEELGPFSWPMPAAGIAVFRVSHWFTEHTSQMQWFCQDSESCSGSDGQQTTRQWLWPLLGASLALGSALERLGPTTELVIAGCHLKSTFCHTSQSYWEMVCSCCVFQNCEFLDLQSAHKASAYQAFLPFQFDLNAKWP